MLGVQGLTMGKHMILSRENSCFIWCKGWDSEINGMVGSNNVWFQRTF